MRRRIQVGYGIGAIGYMIAIFLLAGSPDEAGGVSFVAGLLSILLFAGLSSCLLLSVNDGRWSGRVPWRLYALIILVAGTYAALAEWHEFTVAARYATAGDFLLSLVAITGLVVVHRLAGGRGSDS